MSVLKAPETGVRQWDMGCWYIGTLVCRAQSVEDVEVVWRMCAGCGGLGFSVILES